MIKIQSLLKVADDLVPIEEFSGTLADEDYIEGALELSIGNKPVLTRNEIDYIDQLWAYLVRGFKEVVAGRQFSTFYPGMPVEIVLHPHGDRTTIKVDNRESIIEASAPTIELCRAMATAGTRLFQVLRQLAPGNQAMYDQYITDLRDLVA